MRKLAFGLMLAVLSYLVPVGASEASNLQHGQVYHPKFGNVPYICNMATGYVYFPTLNYGAYAPQHQPQGQQTGGMWRQGSTTGQYYNQYPQGASSYRNPNVGVGAVIDPSLGADGIFIQWR